MDPVKKTDLHTPRAKHYAHGFSLVELLVVIMIMAIISAATIPAIQSTLENTSISMGGQTVVGQINLARQIASSRNVTVQVRLIKLAQVQNSSATGYNAIQLWGAYSGTTNSVALAPLAILPTQVVISEDKTTYSKLLANAGASGAVVTSSNMTVPGGTASYIYFSITPSGVVPVITSDQTTGATSDMTSDYLTVVPARFGATSTTPGSTGAPHNYLIVQVNPNTGTTQAYQP